MSHRDADEDLKAAHIALLEEFGFEARSIPNTAEKRSPDFVATKDGETFVFELKERADDEAAFQTEREQLAQGEVVGSFESMGPNARVAAKTRDGVKQLESLPIAGAFHLLWLHASGRDPETQREQFRATLFGTTEIFSTDSPLKRCYYFHESEFFRHRAFLAGAVITTPSELQICVNTMCPRVLDFRASVLIRTFHNALLDPVHEEKERGVYLADCDSNRRDKQAVLNYLQTKYGKPRLMDMPMTMATARILVKTTGAK